MDPTLTPSNLPPVSLKRSKSSRGGEVFNRQFVAAQIQGHQMLRSIQEEYLKEGKAQPTINVTKLVLGHDKRTPRFAVGFERQQESEL
jgi:putative membrane protein